MRVRGLGRLIQRTLLLVAIVLSATGTVYATTSSSSNYKVSETQFGGGATQQTCSSQYCAQVTLGNTSSNNQPASTSASFDPISPDSNDPRIDMIVETGSSNLGDLSTEQSATKTVIVRIRNYLNDGGYVLQVIGDPPVFKNHNLATPATPTASNPGTEQFGLNVVANTSPSMGADPAQVPSNGVTFGEAATNYDTANQFMYNSGDAVAHSVLKTGRTDYTISIIINIAPDTPAGNYTSNFSAIAVPVY